MGKGLHDAWTLGKAGKKEILELKYSLEMIKGMIISMLFMRG